jgi:hypothetical protein
VGVVAARDAALAGDTTEIMALSEALRARGGELAAAVEEGAAARRACEEGALGERLFSRLAAACWRGGAEAGDVLRLTVRRSTPPSEAPGHHV